MLPGSQLALASELTPATHHSRPISKITAIHSVGTRSLGASFMYRLYKMGDRTLRCGTPACIFLGEEISPSTEALNLLSERKELMSLAVLTEKFNFINLYNKPVCRVISKAFLISRNTAAVHRLLTFKVT
jgi:hypothetical protein